MPNLLKALFFLATIPFAASADGGEDYLVDSIYGLRDVQDIEINTELGRLLVTLSDHVLYFSLFPLELISETPLEIEAASGSLSARGNLFVVGEQDAENVSRGPIGRLQVFEGYQDAPVSEATYDVDLDTTPISEAFFNGSGEFFAVGPTRYSVLNISEQAFMDGFQSGRVLLNDLYLQCGTSAQFSVLQHADQLFYISSVNGAKIIEYGPVRPNEKTARDTDCFNPNRLLASKGGLSTGIRDFSPVKHALVHSQPFIDDEDVIDTGILTFDVDERALVFFPLDYFGKQLSLLRSESIAFQLDAQLGPPDDSSDFGLLASDKDASVILLSYFGSTVVHRLSWRDDSFVYLGRFETEQPVKSLYITPAGDHAGIVSGNVNRGGQEELTVVKWPGRIPEFQALKTSRFSVTALQKELSVNGASELESDGIFGSQTQRALDAYLNQADVAPAQNVGVSTVPQAITSGVPKSAEPARISPTIRGLFPLKIPQKP